MEKTIHEGRNVKRIREMLGIKQDALAIELGDDWNQKKISLLEQKETIEPTILDEVAKALKVPVDAIKNFDEDRVTYNISNLYHIHDNEFKIHDNEMKDSASGSFNAQQFNESEKIIELYERLLKSERELMELRKTIDDKKK